MEAERMRYAARLRGRILLFSVLSGLLMAIVVSAASVWPLYAMLREQREEKLRGVLHARATATEIFLWQSREIAQQIASRTLLRTRLEQLRDDPSLFAEVHQAVGSTLADAMGTAPGLALLSCFTVDGTVLTHVGADSPRALLEWARERIEETEAHRLLVLAGDPYLAVWIAIRDRQERATGGLLLLYDLERFRRRMGRQPGLGAGEETFLGMPGEEEPVLIRLAGPGPAPPAATIADEVGAVIARAATGRSGVEAETASGGRTLLAYRPVEGTQWGLAIRLPEGPLLADIHAQLLRSLGVSLLLLLFLTAGMALLLQPLAGRLLLRSGELAAALEERTASLEEERRRLLAMTEELEAQRARLAAMNEDLDAFTRTVAHDLRTPLVTIQGFADFLLLHADEVKGEESRDALARIAGKARVMGDMIKALLRFARAGKAEIHSERVDVSAMAEEILRDLFGEDPQREVEIRVEPGLTVDADPALLRIVLENLLGNAWKYTARTEGARIEVCGAEAKDKRGFVVRDNGTGFDMIFAEKLFLPFQRLHSDADFGGAGIGLSTVKRIVDQHGGEIRAEGRLGEGADFTVLFPVDTPPGDSSGSAAQEQE